MGLQGERVNCGGQGWVEPATFRFSGGRSYQLSYLACLTIRRRDRRLLTHRNGPHPTHWRP